MGPTQMLVQIVSAVERSHARRLGTFIGIGRDMLSLDVPLQFGFAGEYTSIGAAFPLAFNNAVVAYATAASELGFSGARQDQDGKGKYTLLSVLEYGNPVFESGSWVLPLS